MALAAPRLSVEQLTHGPENHFFGYIGQSKTIPWNGTGRYILSLTTSYHDRMPGAADRARIALIDTMEGNRLIPLDETRAWNFQQGTMFYWNPLAPDTQFFFNDRKPGTNHIYTVLYDIEKRERIREYYFSDSPVGNGGVAPSGSHYAAINYGRLARERPVTGYPDAFDWNPDEKAPKNDGVFVINVASGEKRLAASFHDLREKARAIRPDIDQAGLYINHTLWNRESDTLYFYLRGAYGKKKIFVNIPCTMKADGTSLTMHTTFMGGHPEWGEGNRIIGQHEDTQAVYDIVQQKLVGTLGSADIFPKPGGDVALSPDGTWFVNGSSHAEGRLQYDFLRLSDGLHLRTQNFSRGDLRHGALRIDPAPRWNRTNDAILISSWTEDESRQLFVIRLEDSVDAAAAPAP